MKITRNGDSVTVDLIDGVYLVILKDKQEINIGGQDLIRFSAVLYIQKEVEFIENNNWICILNIIKKGVKC